MLAFLVLLQTWDDFTLDWLVLQTFLEGRRRPESHTSTHLPTWPRVWFYKEGPHQVSPILFSMTRPAAHVSPSNLITQGH